MKIGKFIAFEVAVFILTSFLSFGVCSSGEQSKEKTTEMAKANESEERHPYTSDYHLVDSLVDVKSDPKVAFQKAIEKNDMRFASILVGGFAPRREVPGVDEKSENDPLLTKYGTKVIADVSGDEMPLSEETQRLKDSARIYAKKYNQLLLAKIRSQNN